MTKANFTGLPPAKLTLYLMLGYALRANPTYEFHISVNHALPMPLVGKLICFAKSSMR